MVRWYKPHVARLVSKECRMNRHTSLSVGFFTPLLITMLASILFVPNEIVSAQALDFPSLWQRLFETEPPEPPRDGSRGPLFCAVEPEDNSGRVWSDRPTFVWQGFASAIALYPSNSLTDPLWTHELSETDQIPWIDGMAANGEDQPIYQVTYGGDTALQPGEQYLWKIQKPISPATIWITAIPEDEKEATTEAVDSLEETLRQSGLDEDAIALKRAAYFAEQTLWYDFWQAVVSVEQPSDELRTVMERTVGTWCPPSPSESDTKSDRQTPKM